MAPFLPRGTLVRLRSVRKTYVRLSESHMTNTTSTTFLCILEVGGLAALDQKSQYLEEKEGKIGQQQSSSHLVFCDQSHRGQVSSER